MCDGGVVTQLVGLVVILVGLGRWSGAISRFSQEVPDGTALGKAAKTHRGGETHDERAERSSFLTWECPRDGECGAREVGCR